MDIRDRFVEQLESIKKDTSLYIDNLPVRERDKTFLKTVLGHLVEQNINLTREFFKVSTPHEKEIFQRIMSGGSPPVSASTKLKASWMTLQHILSH